MWLVRASGVCIGRQETQPSVGTLLWAQPSGFPWWPAVVRASTAPAAGLGRNPSSVSFDANPVLSPFPSPCSLVAFPASQVDSIEEGKAFVRYLGEEDIT